MAEEVELPPDVCPSDAEDSPRSAESAVQLPDDLLAEEPCCRKNCLHCVDNEPFRRQARTRLLNSVDQLGSSGRNQLWFSQLLNMNQDNPEGPSRTRLQWHGLDLCQKLTHL